MNPSTPLGIIRTGAEVNLLFNSTKLLAQASSYSNGSFFLVNLVNGVAILENSLTTTSSSQLVLESFSILKLSLELATELLLQPY